MAVLLLISSLLLLGACTPQSPAATPGPREHAPSSAAGPERSAVRQAQQGRQAQHAGQKAGDTEESIHDDLPGAHDTAHDERPPPHPLDGVSSAEILRRIREDLVSLGSISIGLPSSGTLINGVRMPDDPRWHVVDPGHAYGTQETIDYLVKAIAKVHEQHADTLPLHIGHISGPEGGYLKPHLSHQAGRDVDLSYYYSDEQAWYRPGTAETLDLDRTWTLVKALITETDVLFVLIDNSIQTLLRKHAQGLGEDPAWLEDVFRGTPGKTTALIRHVKGHRTHLHVRFYNPIAEETARRAYPALIAEDKVKPASYFIQYTAKKGDSLIKLAKQYDTTVREIQRANGLKSSKIIAKKSYKIPRAGPAAWGPRAVVPARRLPPSKVGRAQVTP